MSVAGSQGEVDNPFGVFEPNKTLEITSLAFVVVAWETQY